MIFFFSCWPLAVCLNQLQPCLVAELSYLPLLTKELVSSVGNNIILLFGGETEDNAHHGRGGKLN